MIWNVIQHPQRYLSLLKPSQNIIKRVYPATITSSRGCLQSMGFVMIFNPSHVLFLWTILWSLSYRNNDLLIISYLTDDLMFPYISSTCARHILWILLTCFRHVLDMAYTCHSFPMLRISCIQHVLLMTYTCSPCCLHAYFSITAGTGWCFPQKNPFLDMFCDF